MLTNIFETAQLGNLHTSEAQKRSTDRASKPTETRIGFSIIKARTFHNCYLQLRKNLDYAKRETTTKSNSA